ncbi:unnamed protein product [Durusdinium trenchii]|uniref:Uncharacterized protein n=1 Tax=Durusdinium trenchii TaxID=1381693 RepID=A0ABP0K983_9DINO
MKFFNDRFWFCVVLATPCRQDFADPILDVSARYHADGWCVFGELDHWVRQCAISRRTGHVKNVLLTHEPYYVKFLNSSTSTPFTFRLFDGRTLVVRDHDLPLDDLFCYVNGLYDLPRSKIVNNFTFLEEVSEKWCKTFEETLPNYFGISMADNANEYRESEAFLLNLQKNGATSGEVPQWVVNNLYLHGAVKCVLRGGNRGAVCEPANCAARACFGEDKSTLLYTARGECERVVFD